MARGGDQRPVLVTGAAGMVGTWLRRTAPDGAEVVSLVHRTSVDDGRTVAADLRDLDAVMRAFARGTAPGLVRPRDLRLRCERARAEIGWDPAPILVGRR